MQEKIVEIKNLSCISGNRYLLHDISWTIKKGEHWLLFGSNGCGKTTLLSIIAGFKKYDSGTAEVFGQSYTSDNICRLRQKIGWVSSSFSTNIIIRNALDIVLSGISGGLGKGFETTNEQLKRAGELLEELKLFDKAERPFDLLSKGERQNVLIARALLAEPELLILDEPGTGLDVFARERMLAMVERMATERHVTIVYVTHYPEEMLPMFDRCLLMKNGTIYQMGRTETLFNDTCISSFVEAPVQVQRQQDKYFLCLRRDAAEKKEGC